MCSPRSFTMGTAGVSAKLCFFQLCDCVLAGIVLIVLSWRWFSGSLGIVFSTTRDDFHCTFMPYWEGRQLFPHLLALHSCESHGFSVWDELALATRIMGNADENVWWYPAGSNVCILADWCDTPKTGLRFGARFLNWSALVFLLNMLHECNLNATHSVHLNLFCLEIQTGCGEVCVFGWL